MLGICAARSSTLSKLDSLRNCPFVKANYFKSGCQLLSVALSVKEVIKRRTLWWDFGGTPNLIDIKKSVHIEAFAWTSKPLSDPLHSDQPDAFELQQLCIGSIPDLLEAGVASVVRHLAYFSGHICWSEKAKGIDPRHRCSRLIESEAVVYALLVNKP